MAHVTAEAIAVRGYCNAALEVGDQFILEGLRITPQCGDKSCTLAFASLVNNVGRLRLQQGPICVACPDPGTGEGGNVLFRLSWEADDAIDHG